MIFLPSSTLVPSSRTTSGTCSPTSLTAADHALGDHVALHDAAEDVDQNPLHLRIRGDDLERGRHLLLGGAAADVEEVRRRLAVELDDVHGRHGEAGAVDHAADGAVERHVVEIVFRGLDLLLVLLGQVAQREDIRMSIERVVVEADLGVEADELAALGDDQRIDLEQAHVLGDERRVELAHHAFRLLGEIAGETEHLRHPPAVMRHDAGRRIDREGQDLLRMACAPPPRCPCRLRSTPRRRRASVSRSTSAER